MSTVAEPSAHLLADTAEVVELVASIRDPRRSIPVLVVTTRNREVDPIIDVAGLARAAAPLPVVLLPTGPLTWELTALLPDELGVFGGAGRIWWPGYSDDDDPRSHPLFFAYEASEGERAARRMLEALERRGHDVTDLPAPPTAASLAAIAGEEVQGTVTAVIYLGIDILLEDGREAFVPTSMASTAILDHPRDAFVIGQAVSGHLSGGTRDTRLELDLRPPAARAEAPAPPSIGTIIDAIVISANAAGAELEVHQGLRGWFRLPRKAPQPSPGSTLRVRVISVSGSEVSFETAPRETPARSAAPIVGPRPQFLPGPPQPRAVPATSDPLETQAELEKALRAVTLLQEALNVAEQRARSSETDKREALTTYGRQLSDARKELKGARDRNSHLEDRLHGRGSFDDPAEQVSYEIYVAWKRSTTASDRQRWQLADIVIGPDLLSSIEALEGIERTKVIDVCADVVCGRAAELHSREVHALRSDSGGDSAQRVRADGAKAMRVSLQQNTPSARRLHYWKLPGGGIELSKVGTHDDLTIT